MSDISAVVLSIGEETTQRAIDSIKTQTLPPKEIVVIKNITPVHKAINLGASKVKSEFFILVDADMILDVSCLEDLLQCMAPHVGIVVGQLKDQLLGRTECIRLLRTKCFENVKYKDSISPDTDFIDDIQQNGWGIVYALKFGDDSRKEQWHTFGDHKPAYTFLYTYSKHILEGKRYQYRKDLGGLRWHLSELQKSKHDAALVARIAMAHGVFLETESDLLMPFCESDDYIFLKNFLESNGSYKIKDIKTQVFTLPNTKVIFKKYYKLGIELRNANAFPSFKSYLNSLEQFPRGFSFIAKIGLCHGLFKKKYKEEIFKREYNKLQKSLSESNFIFNPLNEKKFMNTFSLSKIIKKLLKL
jgi:hypothetical protein